ncbi:MAG: VOC family protein [Myxococcaceae bacterium]
MTKPNPFRGVATLSFFAADHAAAKRWYSELLGLAPYFERPGYAEFRLGDDQVELGLIDSAYVKAIDHAHAPAGVVVYWHVDDLDGTLARLLALGAKPVEPKTERGHGFVTATVADPFGNLVGVMTNPHYLEVRGSRPAP